MKKRSVSTGAVGRNQADTPPFFESWMVAPLLAAPDAPFDLPQCLDGLRRGEDRAARAFVERFEPQVRRLVRAHRPRSLGEDDLVQDVLVAVFTRLDRYTARDGIPFEHWLTRLTINVCLDALRSERRHIRTVPILPEARAWIESLLPDRQAPPDETLGARQAVGALLDALPPADRAVLTWLHLEDRSVDEVAALTGWSRTRIKVRAFRARRRLRGAARLLTEAPETSDE